MRKLIATATLAALMVGAFGAAPVLAQDVAGTLTISALPGTVIDRDGEVTLRFTYNCIPYDAPNDGFDIIVASIASAWDLAYVSPIYYGTCDGTDRRITFTLYIHDDGLSGPARLTFSHLWYAADFQTAYANEAGNVKLPITVVVAGPR